MDWALECSGCAKHEDADGLPTVCPGCGSPWLVRYARQVSAGVRAALLERPRGMWRYREFLPLVGGERVPLGQGGGVRVRHPLLDLLERLVLVFHQVGVQFLVVPCDSSI